MNSPWERLLSASPQPEWRRLGWRMLRQWASPEQLSQEFGWQLDWQWTIARQSTAADASAIKLLLAARDSAVRCETVVLFPPGPRVPAERVPAERVVAERVMAGKGLVDLSRGKPRRATVCISSQPGCGVGCPFCSTGQLGYRGNLSAAQIVEQVYWAGVIAREQGRSLRNVVFMGMGEPLHNSAAVLEAIDWLTADHGFGLSPQRMTVSTAGVPAAMVRLAERFPRVRIALSLHSADAVQRCALVPRATRDLALLKQTIARLNELQSHAVWIEIVLFDQLNDTLEHARQVVDFCRGLRVEVNLIPYNLAGQPSLFTASPLERREAFAEVLRSAGLRASLRTSLGSDATAACGQLTAKG